MAYSYLAPQRDQLFLMPTSMRDWLEDGHLAWFIIDVVEQMDTTALHKIHPNDGSGRPAYDPEMMCALLLYAYSNTVRSSRRIEASCHTDAAYRVICGELTPDHATIARFVVNQQDALEGLFVQGLRLCAAAGLVDLSVVALDGTKIGADAALDQNHSAAWIQREVKALLEATIASETAEAPAPPVPLPGIDALSAASTPRGRHARLDAALAVIAAEDQAVAAKAQQNAKAALAEAEQGRKLPGRKPKDPAAALARAQADYAAALTRAQAKQAKREARIAANAARAPHPDRAAGPDRALARAQEELTAAQKAAQAAPPAPHKANVTDPDSRIMKTQKGWIQGYNSQAIVNKHQIVLACAVSQNTNDVELYEPMITKLAQTLDAAGITNAANIIDAVRQALADAGYWSEANATSPGPDRLIATLKDYKQRRAARELGTTTGPPPEDATPLDAMEHRLRTPEGAAAYAQRSYTIEPVFGDRKTNRGWTHFRRRGLPAATSEWAFMHLTGNLAKLYKHQRAQNTATA
ncbi:MAG: transposase [Solirubrobacteraceae bacterium]